jgi:hypothetical protein
LYYLPFLTHLTKIYQDVSGRIISYGIQTPTGIWAHMFASLDTFLLAPCATSSANLPNSVSLGTGLTVAGISYPGSIAFSDSTVSLVITPFNLIGDNFCNLLSAQTMFSEKDFTIFPIPATSSINISIPFFSKKSELRIFNVAGKKVLSKTITSVNEKINIENLQDGIYFVQLQSEFGIAVRKLIVHKI